jgi:hypothetical protein
MHEADTILDVVCRCPCMVSQSPSNTAILEDEISLAYLKDFLRVHVARGHGQSGAAPPVSSSLSGASATPAAAAAAHEHAPVAESDDVVAHGDEALFFSQFQLTHRFPATLWSDALIFFENR